MKLGASCGALLATGSAAALSVGAGTAPAAAACYTGPFPFTNNVVQSCIQVANTSFSGYVTNNGIIAPGGIAVTGSTIIGGIADNGATLSGGITVDNRSQIIGVGSITAIAVSLSTFSGGISHAGTIIAGGSGISVGAVSTFAGGITNSGSVTAGFNGVVLFGPSAFSGGVLNSGSISASSGIGVLVASVSTFAGGITNTGTITAAAGILAGYPGFSVTTFSGNIINSGKITAAQTGIGVFSISTFTGGVTNSGTITAGDAGIVVGAPTETRLQRRGVNLLDASPSAVTISGAILNSGSIAAKTGILVSGGSAIAGGITNSGNITGSRAAIDVTGEGAATTINLSAGTITGAILLSSLSDVVNISGGTVNGNIVGSGASDTINFALGAGNAFTYASPFGFSGINQVNINSGTVVLDGVNTANSVIVNGGATLAGTGTIDPVAVIVNSGGTLAPGPLGGLGTLSIVGTLAFNAGSFYAVQIAPGTGNNSKTAVTGSANLSGNGTVVVTPLPVGRYDTIYQILTTTGGLAGTFAGLTFSGPFGSFAGTLRLDYTTNPGDVDLDVFGSFLIATPFGANVNQQSVISGVNSGIINGSANTALPPQFASLANLSGPALLNAATQLSGEVATDAEKGAFSLMDQFLNLMLDPFVSGRCGPGDWQDPFGSCRDVASGQAIGFAPDQPTGFPSDIALAYDAVLKAPPQTLDQRWRVWGSSFGGYNQTDGDPVIGSHNVVARDYGFAAGVDYRFLPNTILGFALAGGRTNWGLAQGLGGGSSDAFQSGVYGKTYYGPAYVAAALAYADHWMSTNRTALGDQLTASFNGQSYGGRVEAGYRYGVPAIAVTPYAALQAQGFHTPSYSETDVNGGGLGLSYNAMSATDTRSEVGARFDDQTWLGTMPFLLRARVAWAHDWVTNPALDAVFEALPGSSFTVNGAAPPANSALVSAGAELRLSHNWSLGAKFDGEFASGSQTYAGTGILRYIW